MRFHFFRRGLAAFLLLILGMFFAGFFHFVASLDMDSPKAPPQADGIVVLTGGASRISDAVGLLGGGRGRRLLVTGLNPSTSRHDLARVMGKQSYLVECCVDLDYEAKNTIGNAREAAEWAQKNNFVKLIIVTSNYHMPRTLLELKRAYPRGEFMPHTVESPNIELHGWWMHIPTLRLLIGEYIKYLAAFARYVITAEYA